MPDARGDQLRSFLASAEADQRGWHSGLAVLGAGALVSVVGWIPVALPSTFFSTLIDAGLKKVLDAADPSAGAADALGDVGEKQRLT